MWKGLVGRGGREEALCGGHYSLASTKQKPAVRAKQLDGPSTSRHRQNLKPSVSSAPSTQGTGRSISLRAAATKTPHNMASPFPGSPVGDSPSERAVISEPRRSSLKEAAGDSNTTNETSRVRLARRQNLRSSSRTSLEELPPGFLSCVSPAAAAAAAAATRRLPWWRNRASRSKILRRAGEETLPFSSPFGG